MKKYPVWRTNYSEGFLRLRARDICSCWKGAGARPSGLERTMEEEEGTLLNKVCGVAQGLRWPPETMESAILFGFNDAGVGWALGGVGAHPGASSSGSGS